MTIKLVPFGGEARISEYYFGDSGTPSYQVVSEIYEGKWHYTPEAAAEAWNAGAKELVPLSEVLELLECCDGFIPERKPSDTENDFCADDLRAAINNLKQKYGVSE